MTMPLTLFDAPDVLETCPNCLYWDHHLNDPYGVCRANPPAGNGWPRTSRDDWCGHWEAAPIPEPVQEVVKTKKTRKKQTA